MTNQSDKKTADHLVLVVHGIGEQKEGETVDQVVSGAVGEHERICSETGTDAPLTIRDQLVHLPEKKFEDVDRSKPERPGIFPVHFKRIFAPKSGGEDGQEQTTVFAEVFWADKSTAPSGTFATIFDLIKILLAVVFLAIDNAENVQNKLAYRLVQAFCVAFFSGVLAINGLLLMGVIVLAVETQAVGLITLSDPWDSSAEWVIGITATLTAMFGLWACVTRKDYYLWRLLGRGLLFWAAVSFAYMIFAPAAPHVAGSDSDMVRHFEIRQLDQYIAYAFFLMRILWGPAILACMLLFVVWAFDGKTLDHVKKGQRRIYAPICAAVVLLWMVMAASFWQGVKQLTNPLGISGIEHDGHTHQSDGVLFQAFEEHLVNALQVAMAGGVGFAALIIAAIVVVVMRAINKDTLHDATNPIYARLLLNPVLQLIFSLSAVLITMMIVLVIGREYFSFGEMADFFGLVGLLQEATPVIAPALLLIGVAVYQGSGAVAGVLGVLRDIVVYASSNKSNPSMQANPENFPDRAQIEYRFRRVFDYMVENEKPEHITVICHSQGTVVTTRSLRKILQDKGQMPCSVTLVTMGSPVTHLYRQYFPRDFFIPENGLDGIMWHNIFRTDDFVGTRITDVAQNQVNHMVPAGGHPGYFTDPTVWSIYSDAVEFSLCGHKAQV